MDVDNGAGDTFIAKVSTFKEFATGRINYNWIQTCTCSDFSKRDFAICFQNSSSCQKVNPR